MRIGSEPYKPDIEHSCFGCFDRQNFYINSTGYHNAGDVGAPFLFRSFHCFVAHTTEHILRSLGFPLYPTIRQLRIRPRAREPRALQHYQRRLIRVPQFNVSGRTPESLDLFLCLHSSSSGTGRWHLSKTLLQPKSAPDPDLQRARSRGLLRSCTNLC